MSKKVSNRIFNQRGITNAPKTTQVISDEELHPRYTEEDSLAFVREIYRLKGFAHLRNQ